MGVIFCQLFLSFNTSDRNHVTGWELAPMEFGDVNLLVGVSGVGKTKILEAIRSLQKIALGDNSSHQYTNGVEWNITFSMSSNSVCIWNGKFNIVESVTSIPNELDDRTWLSTRKNNHRLEIEELYLDGNPIACRNGDGTIKFENQMMPKLLPAESVIKIFESEDRIAPISNALKLIFDSQAQRSEKWVSFSPLEQINNLSLSEIRSIHCALPDKLGLLWVNDRALFDRIKSNFIEVFSQVENLAEHSKFEWHEKARPVFLLELKEIGVDRWITQSNLSMGMLKTLAHIVEIHLLSEGSILLIDEFENSLGINCIDVVTELLNDRKDIQFIITSHHPYIINKIPMQYWKIITRKGSIVTATDATDYEELSGSRHKVFTQLINLPDYTEGIQVG
jgi:ABC-type Na+ transport system ATPase subunit NatA